ncbi:ankyrin, partial [Coprinopsis marcescibilis]
KWVFKDGKFVRWKGRRKSVLWGTGMPGAGKTILASIIIEYFINLAKENRRICVAFAFCRYTENLTVEQTLSGLIRQVLEDHPSTFAFIIPLYEHHTLRETRPSQTELLGILNAIASSDLFDNTFCFIDGLDEATSNTQFDLLDTVSQLPINFMFMSRPLPLLKDHVPEADFVDIIVQDADIERLIEDKLRGMKALARILEKDGWREKVLATVLKKSDGMFLVASLQLDMLRSCINIDGLRKALDGLPSGVGAMYSATMERIEAQDDPNVVKRALTWLVHTRRPLSMDDLLHALAVYPDTFKFNPELLLTTDTLLSLCCGLVTYEPRSNMVRLVHYTAKDFLEPYLKRENPNPHSMIACICVEHLLHHSLHVWINTDPDPHETIYRKYPFVEYAHKNWAPHSRRSISLPIPVGNFILQCSSFLAGGEDWIYAECISAVHVAAILGFHQLIHDWINPTHPTAAIFPPPSIFDINARTATYGNTPLILAASKNRLETVNVLLMAEGIDPWCIDNEGWTALMYASFSGYSDIVQSILRFRDTDCITKYTDGDTRGSGGEQAVIGVNIVNNDGFSALTIAVFHGRAAEVEMLLGVEGIDVNHMTGSGETALMLASRKASRKERKPIVKLILRHENIDVDVANPQGITALGYALRRQDLEIAALLRVHGAREPSVDILE